MTGYVLPQGNGGLHRMPHMRSCSAVLTLLLHVQALPQSPRLWTAEVMDASAAGRHRPPPAEARFPAPAGEPFRPAVRIAGGRTSPREQHPGAALSALRFGPAGNGDSGLRYAAPEGTEGELAFAPAPAAARAVFPQLPAAAAMARGVASPPSPTARGFYSPPLAAEAFPHAAGAPAWQPVRAAARSFQGGLTDAQAGAWHAREPAAAGGGPPQGQGVGVPALVRAGSTRSAARRLSPRTLAPTGCEAGAPLRCMAMGGPRGASGAAHPVPVSPPVPLSARALLRRIHVCGRVGGSLVLLLWVLHGTNTLP